MKLANVINSKKNSLKKKPLITLKHILAQPFPRYWPQVNEEKLQELTQITNELKIEDFRPSTLFGLQEVSRAIQSEGTSCKYLLLSTEIKPQFVTQQVITLAVSNHKNVSILVVPDLSVLLKNSIGFGSLAILFNDDNPKLSKLIDWVESTSKLLPIPQKIIEYFFPAEVQRPKIDKKVVETKSDEVFNVSSLYLTRSVGEERAFVPTVRKSSIKVKKIPETTFIKPAQIESELKMDFISFGDSEQSEEEEEDEDCEKEISLADEAMNIGHEKTIEAPKILKLYKKDPVSRNAPKLIENPPKEISKKEKVTKNVHLTNKTDNKKRNKNGKNKKGKKPQQEKPVSGSQNLFDYISLTVHKIKNNGDKIKKKNKFKNKSK